VINHDADCIPGLTHYVLKGRRSERLAVLIHPFRVNGTTNDSRPHTEPLLLAAPHAAHGHAQHRREFPSVSAAESLAVFENTTGEASSVGPGAKFLLSYAFPLSSPCPSLLSRVLIRALRNKYIYVCNNNLAKTTVSITPSWSKRLKANSQSLI
jgi:hypothetical protein